LQVHRNLGAQGPFDLVVPLDHLPQPSDLGMSEVAHPRVRADPGLSEHLARVVGADTEDVRESVLDFLVAWQIDARNTCHPLALPLLVLGCALADDPDHTSPLDHLAVLTN